MNDCGIVVLTNGMHRSQLSRTGWKPDLAAHMRVVAAATLYKEKRDYSKPYFLISGGKINGEGNPSLSRILGTLARSNDVSLEDLFLEENSIDTTENAEFSMELIRKEGLANKIYLVTSRYHLPRSVSAFKKYGANIESAISAEEILRRISLRHRNFVNSYEKDCRVLKNYLRNSFLYAVFNLFGPDLLRKLAHNELEKNGERFVPNK